ncbi:MAG: hypothetical protein MI806_24075 [Minwuiales bacterium]|nr:hypothetical protein [Minwuiales bacterium]
MVLSGANKLRIVVYSALLIVLLWALPAFKSERFSDRPPVAGVDGLTLIAHAGGGLPSGVYSNAREAFDAAYAAGIRSFEVDLKLTRDGKPVLLHDWGDAWLRWHRSGVIRPALAGLGLLRFLPPSHADFINGRMTDRLTPMDLDRLCDWAGTNSNVVLLMDLKEGANALLPVLAETPDACRAKMVPQVWTPDEYRWATELGFDRVALTVYKSKLATEEIEAFVREHDPYYLVMPAGRATPETVARVTAFGDPLVLHTVNGLGRAEAFAAMGVHGLITDSLVPGLRNSE